MIDIVKKEFDPFKSTLGEHFLVLKLNQDFFKYEKLFDNKVNHFVHPTISFVSVQLVVQFVLRTNAIFWWAIKKQTFHKKSEPSSCCEDIDVSNKQILRVRFFWFHVMSWHSGQRRATTGPTRYPKASKKRFVWKRTTFVMATDVIRNHVNTEKRRLIDCWRTGWKCSQTNTFGRLKWKKKKINCCIDISLHSI